MWTSTSTSYSNDWTPPSKSWVQPAGVGHNSWVRTSRRWIKPSKSWMKTSSMAHYARASGAGCVGPHHPGEQNILSYWRILFLWHRGPTWQQGGGGDGVEGPGSPLLLAPPWMAHCWILSRWWWSSKATMIAPPWHIAFWYNWIVYFMARYDGPTGAHCHSI